MKTRNSLFALALLSAAPAHAQVTITASDMYNQAGQYFRAYANYFDPYNSTTAYSTGGVMGNSGGPNFWDFSVGPTNQVFRYDYLASAGVPEAASFPQAKIGERKTVEGTNSVSWLFFEQVPGTGRKVYGFYDTSFSSDQPDNVFNPPIIDFPDTIHYGDVWNTTTTITTLVSLIDPDISGSIPVQVTFSSAFKVDAYGTVELPLLSFGDCLRVNENETITTAADLDGTGNYQPVETDYAHNFYWLRPGYGICAQINSTQASSPPPDNFDQATAFMRMFETNKKPGTSTNTGIAAVTDLRAVVNGSQLLIKWTAPPATQHFRLEYSNSTLAPASWKPLTTITNLTQPFYLDTTSSDTMRFYRVVSLP